MSEKETEAKRSHKRKIHFDFEELFFVSDKDGVFTFGVHKTLAEAKKELEENVTGDLVAVAQIRVVYKKP